MSQRTLGAFIDDPRYDAIHPLSIKFEESGDRLRQYSLFGPGSGSWGGGKERNVTQMSIGAGEGSTAISWGIYKGPHRCGGRRINARYHKT